MAKYLFAHNAKNLVKKGDKVKAYDNYIGEIGNANGVYFSHLHYSVSVGLSIAQIKAYINGWSVAKVKEFYREPDIDRDKMFEKPVDNGQAGYDWLQTINNGSPHPGRDYNGFGGGDSDYGYKFKSPVDGEVEFVGDWGKGWGKVILIDDNSSNNTMSKYYITSKLRDELKELWKDFNHDDKKSQEKMADKLDNFTDEVEKEKDILMNRLKTLIKDQDALNRAYDIDLEKQKNALTTEYNKNLEKLNKKLEVCEKLKDGALLLAEDGECKETIKLQDEVIKNLRLEINKQDLRIADLKKNEGIFERALNIISNFFKKINIKK
jgi:hypothetical protein